MSPHDPRETQPSDGGSGDPFPRQRIAEAVAGAQQNQDRRWTAATWLMAIGLGSIALGWPDPRLVGRMNLVRSAAEGGESLTGMPSLVRATAWITDSGHEPAAFLLAALAWALLLPALRRLLRTVGFTPSESLLLALAGTLAPTAFRGGALPIEHAPGMLGATWLATTLFRTRQSHTFGYSWRVTLVLFGAVLLRLENLLLAPAAALALADQGRARGVPRVLQPACLVLVLGFSLTILFGDEGWSEAVRSLLAGANPSGRHLVGWLVEIAIGLGVLCPGLASLLWSRRAPEETPPPRWVVPWCVVVLVPVLGGSSTVGPSVGFLIPMAVLGLADWRSRNDDLTRLIRSGGLLLGVQLGLSLGVRLQDPDPLRGWRTAIRTHLSAGDALWTDNPGHAYWIRHRWLEIELRDPDSTSLPEPPGRAVLDSGIPAPLPGMLRLIPGRGLVPVEAAPSVRKADDRKEEGEMNR